MSGMAATEDRLQEGAVNVRIGEGRTAEVLRNLCFQIHSQDDQTSWNALVLQIKGLFGVTLNPPEFIKERGQITMSYEEAGSELDLVSSGRGLQQTLLLLAHLYTHPRAVLLLDEPDAHLEILRQRQIYQILTSTADSQGCQVIAASHSEVLLNEAADRDIVVAFVGKPHRIDDRRSQVLKSLRAGRTEGMGLLFGGFYRPCNPSGIRENPGSSCARGSGAAVCALRRQSATQGERPLFRIEGG
jgi:hypothetical protein